MGDELTVRQVIEAAIAAYERKDLEGALGHCAPDIRFSNAADPATGMQCFDCQGIEAFRAALIDIASAFEIERYALVSLIVEGGHAASRQRLTLVSRATGARLETEIAGFWEVRDGRIVSLREFNDTALIIANSPARG